MEKTKTSETSHFLIETPLKMAFGLYLRNSRQISTILNRPLHKNKNIYMRYKYRL